MPVALSEEAEASSFVFALPAQPDWADALASITLSGPAGTTTLDGNSDIPMAILRDPVTGRVRGFLRDVGDPAAEEMGRGWAGPALQPGHSGRGGLAEMRRNWETTSLPRLRGTYGGVYGDIKHWTYPRR